MLKLPDDVLKDSLEAETELFVETPHHRGRTDIPEQNWPRLVSSDVEYDVSLILR